MMSATANMQNARGENSTANSPRRFEFEQDSFAFANELIWEYRFDTASRRTTFARRDPKPDYAHRCFVLTCAARQFLFHATFDPASSRVSDEAYRHLVRGVLSRSPRHPSEPTQRICFPGYENLRQFSVDHERLLKAECGGAWRSYVLRSHWRMVFPISRAHQVRTASRLADTVKSKGSAVVHLVTFPKLAINHGMVVCGARTTNDGFIFDAYDPNDPRQPARLSFDHSSRTFQLPANSYWAGGNLDVIEIYRNWFL
jgi:hypothetical protein